MRNGGKAPGILGPRAQILIKIIMILMRRDEKVRLLPLDSLLKNQQCAVEERQKENRATCHADNTKSVSFVVI